MPAPTDETLEALRLLARQAAEKAHVPYSGRPEAAVLLLSDGTWLPGVRVESASFSLLIPPLVNAFSTAVALARTDVAAAVLSRPLQLEDRAFMAALPWGSFTPRGDDALVLETPARLRPPRAQLSPFLDAPVPPDADAGIELARAAARRAYVPASGYHVGCVLQLSDGRLIPGVNVEHTDWTRILCAERNALGTAVSYGLPRAEKLYLTCLPDPSGTPCGACRQLLAELAQEAELWMDRGPQPPEAARPADLLPGFFTGRALSRH